MNITWGADENQPDGRCLATRPIGAGYDENRPDEHFVLRVRPAGDRVVWMVDFHTDHMAAPYESVASGEAPDQPSAQRQATRAMLDLIDTGNPPERTDHLSDEQITAVMTAYAGIVETNHAELAVAGLDGQGEVIDAEIVQEVLEFATDIEGIHTTNLDADSYRRLTAAVAAFRQSIRAGVVEQSLTPEPVYTRREHTRIEWTEGTLTPARSTQRPV